MVKDDGGALLLREPSEGIDEVPRALVHLVGRADERQASTAPLEFTRCDPKRSTPKPGLGVADLGPPPQCLCECLSHRVARHLRVTREGQDRAPHPFPALPVEALELPLTLQYVAHRSIRRSRDL